MTFHTVEIISSPPGLSVQWRSPPSEAPRAVDPDAHARINQQRALLEEAGRRGNPEELAEAQRQLGETLFHLLDGPGGALQHRVETARASGESLHLVLRLLTSPPQTFQEHPALEWHLQLLTPPGPVSVWPLALQTGVTFTLQFGKVETAKPVELEHGRLQVLFMASAPRDVEPQLDYEVEEERILDKLAPFIERRRLAVHFAESGSLDELRRRLMDRQYDIVHLSGQGVLTSQGPRFLMEDEAGDPDEVSPERLFKALRAGRDMPRLVVISSYHTPEQRSVLHRLAAELLQKGLPCIVGLTRLVGDGVPPQATVEMYHCLCNGETPTQALARARQSFHEEDLLRPPPTHAWATFQLLTTRPAGFTLNTKRQPVLEETLAPEFSYRRLGNHMRVLERGFLGRRRELQSLGRILRRGTWSPPHESQRSVAGAAVIGKKGQGKSCLVGRALYHHSQDLGGLSIVVLHGALDAESLRRTFLEEALLMNDTVAEDLLRDGTDMPGSDRTDKLFRDIQWLLLYRWHTRPLVIVLDDFEKNLDISSEGEGSLHGLAAKLLEVLLPACKAGSSRLLLTSTDRFTLPDHLKSDLVVLELDPLEKASVRKLWSHGRLSDILSVEDWAHLSECLGRNAYALNCARQVLEGGPYFPPEVQALAARASVELQLKKGAKLDKAGQEALVEFLRKHMNFAEGTALVEPEALASRERARTYQEPVPAEALSRPTEALSVSVENLVALKNMGLLEVKTQDASQRYRVDPQLKEDNDAPDDAE